MELLDRAEKTGYKTLQLTVDVPIQFRRAKDNKNGFTVPFNIGLNNLLILQPILIGQFQLY